MTRDILVTISGKRMIDGEDEGVELVMPGTHKEENGYHLIQYTEPGDGADGETENTILIGGGCMKIKKKGLANVQMDFLNRSERVKSCYSTPYGDFLIGITTRDIRIDEDENALRVDVKYAMDVGNDHLSDCAICVKVSPRKEARE